MLAFEVLDNLPHDCVALQEAGGEWQEVTVDTEASGERRLGGRPLRDPLIRHVLAAAHWDNTGVAATVDNCDVFQCVAAPPNFASHRLFVLEAFLVVISYPAPRQHDPASAAPALLSVQLLR